MFLRDIVSISELGGLYKIVVQRPDGVLVSPLGENKTRFVSQRKHSFTPLEGITIYTEDEENVELRDVILEMKKRQDELPIPDPTSDNSKLFDYLREIVPNFDEERVYASDVKKIIKWFNLMNQQDLIKPTAETETPEGLDEEEVEASGDEKGKDAGEGEEE